jgi:hypothetical protein
VSVIINYDFDLTVYFQKAVSKSNLIYLKFLYFSKSLPGTLCASVPILGNCKNLRAQSQWLLDGDIQVKFLGNDPLLQIRHASVPDPYI